MCSHWQNLRNFHFAEDFTLPTALYNIWYVQAVN